MQVLSLSIKFIDVVVKFQQLPPYQQTEFLQYIQDEYAYTETPISLSDIDITDSRDYEYYTIYTIIGLFYEHYDDNNFSSIMEDAIFATYESDPSSLNILLKVADTLDNYLSGF